MTRPEAPSPRPVPRWALLVVLLLVAASAVAWLRWSNLPDDVAVPAAAGGPVPIVEPGGYSVFLETRAGYGSADALPTVSGPGGPVPLSPAAHQENYDLGSRSGFLIGSFDAPVPGTYVLSGAPGARGIGAALVVSAGGLAPLLGAIFATTGAVVAAVLLIVTAVRRRSHRPPPAPPRWTVH